MNLGETDTHTHTHTHTHTTVYGFYYSKGAVKCEQVHVYKNV